VLLPVDGVACLLFVFANVLALIARYHAIGLSRLLILADIGFPVAQRGRFGAGQLAAGHALTDAGALVGLALVDAGRGSLGLSQLRNGQ